MAEKLWHTVILCVGAFDIARAFKDLLSAQQQFSLGLGVGLVGVFVALAARRGL